MKLYLVSVFFSVVGCAGLLCGCAKKEPNPDIRLLIVALIPCATLFLVSCGGNSPWQEIVDKDNYLLERRNKQGELVLHERVMHDVKRKTKLLAIFGLCLVAVIVILFSH